MSTKGQFDNQTEDRPPGFPLGYRFPHGGSSPVAGSVILPLSKAIRIVDTAPAALWYGFKPIPDISRAIELEIHGRDIGDVQDKARILADAAGVNIIGC